MRIVYPSVEYLPQTDIVSHVARCARVCYGRESGNDEKTYNNLIKDGHWSVFRHASYYAIVPRENDSCFDVYLYWLVVYNYNVIGIDVTIDTDFYYVAYNGNYALDNPDFHESMQSYLVSPEEFAKHAPELMRYTFKVVTQISTSRELNRVSPNNIAEMSTRYVDLENGVLCKPHWLSMDTLDEIYRSGTTTEDEVKEYIYYTSCVDAFNRYKYLIGQGVKREDARGVLPLDTATTVVYTYNLREWRHIIELRTSERAHPNAQIIANMIKDELVKLGQNV